MALTDNLVAYWDLSEASGTRADGLGANNLTDNNTVTGTTGPGSHNASLFTHANNESLSHTDNATLSMGDIDFTACVWIKFTTLILYTNIFGQWNSSTNQRSWTVYYDDNTFLTFGASSNGTIETFLSNNNTGAITTGVWYFVVVWHDSIGNTMNFQVNEGTVKSASYTTGVFDSSAVFNFGVHDGNTNYQDGAMAMAGLWKRILTAGERTTLFNSNNALSYAEILALAGDPVGSIRPRTTVSIVP